MRTALLTIVIIFSCTIAYRRDGWLDVYTFMPFGERLFLEEHVPKARIAPSDLLAIFPFERCFSHANAGDATASPESVRRVHRVDVVEPEAV